jgi:rare lipoprotein A
MIALIPGLEKTLAYWRPKASATPAENFARILDAVSPTSSAAKPAPATYQVQPGDNLTSIAKKLGFRDPLALARANRLKDPDLLKAGQVLTLPAPGAPESPLAPSPAQAGKAIPPSSAGGAVLVKASWYGPRHHGRLMANGQPFDMFADTAAHRSLPLGTRLKVTNPANGRSVEVAVTDRGPFICGRTLDLSWGAARKLGIVEAGVCPLHVEKTSG